MGKLLNEMGNCPFASPLIAPLLLRRVRVYVCSINRQDLVNEIVYFETKKGISGTDMQ